MTGVQTSSRVNIRTLSNPYSMGMGLFAFLPNTWAGLAMAVPTAKAVTMPQRRRILTCESTEDLIKRKNEDEKDRQLCSEEE